MTAAPTDFLSVVVAALIVLAVVVAYRVVRGPTLQDRVIAVNTLGTTVVIAVALLAPAFDDPGLLDVALAYALLNFLLSIGLARVAADRTPSETSTPGGVE